MNAPLIRCGMPQANSTTSWPRATSPLASESTLPCSLVMIAASSPLRAFSSSRNAKRTWVRLASEVSRQPGNAAAAPATIAFTSSSDAMASWALTSPVAGLVTSLKRPPVPSYVAPFSQWWRVVAIAGFLACLVGWVFRAG